VKPAQAMHSPRERTAAVLNDHRERKGPIARKQHSNQIF